MIKNRPSEVISPNLKKRTNKQKKEKKKKETTFAYVNKQPRLQIFFFPPTEKVKSIKTKVQSKDWKSRRFFVVKVAITYKVGILDLKKGGKQSPSSEEE